MELGERCAHSDPELRIEVRERLVHQERPRLAHDRPPHRHALPLTPRQLGGLSVEQLRQPEQGGHVVQAAPRLDLRRLPHLEPVAEVLAYGHVRIERVALEDHGNVATARREVGHVDLVDSGRAAGDLLETGDHAQEGGLAAPRRADEHHELAVRDRDAHVVDGHESVAVDLRHPVELDPRHAPTASPRAGAPRRRASYRFAQPPENIGLDHSTTTCIDWHTWDRCATSPSSRVW